MKVLMSRRLLAAVLVATLVAGTVMVWRNVETSRRIVVSAYFANSNGVYVGDDVRILGIPVGRITSIEPLPGQSRITFWYEDQYDVPAAANAVVISPTLISARAIQLTPAYEGGPKMPSGAVIPEDRTAVPVEWDELRAQLDKLADTLAPSQPGGVAPAGAFITTAADNLRGNGEAVREALVKLSRAASALGDHSDDIFTTVRNLAMLVTALQDSSQLMSDLNVNLAAVTGLLTNRSDEVGSALDALSQASINLSRFVSDNREPLGATVDRVASLTSALNETNYDLKQVLHIAPTLLANYVNIYQPAQNAVTGILAMNNFADPVQFICSAVEAASRLGAEQSAKLCVQYLAPIVKNRQYNFPPLAFNPFVGATARPNEITYSEDRLRPDYQPPDTAAPPAPDPGPPPVSPGDVPAAPTDPSAGLSGMMVPQGPGS